MADMASRLARLRAIASNATTSNYGRELVEGLIEQEPGNPEVTCPQFAGLCEHAGERLIIPSDDAAELIRDLIEHALGDPPHRPEAIIDLDTGIRHALIGALELTAIPGLPGSDGERLVRLLPGHRSALRLLLDVAEEHCDENQELREAIAVGDALLASTYPRRTGA